MAEFDTLITGGVVFDGTGSARFNGDVGIKDGVITKVSREVRLDPATADKVIDAKGMNVCPGFIDLHTHYDAQIQWDPYVTLSGWHGVTSIVLGNCGFGFAPCAPENRDRAMLMMSRVEAIPFESMKEGMKWDWETFPEWLDYLDRAPLGVNVISYVPIGPIMNSVMGIEEAKKREPTEAEVAEMCELLNEGMDAGGCGWSVQRLGDGYMSVQRDYDGTPMATDTMSDELCMAFADVLKNRGDGNIQMSAVGGLRFIEKMAKESGRPIIYNAIQSHDKYPGSFRRILQWITDARAGGANIWGQAILNANEEYFRLDDFNLLDGTDEWREVTLGTVPERIVKMNDPKNREALREHFDHGRAPAMTGPIQEWVIDDCIKEENKKYEGLSTIELGEAMGKHPLDAMLDLTTSEDLLTTFYHRSFNLDPAFNKEIVDAPFTIPGVSDGGAHTRYITAGRYPTDFICNIVRGKGLTSLEHAHYALSCIPARCAGFYNRGTLEEGMKADVLVYDFENLNIVPEKPVIVHDFPAGEWRRVQYAEGYKFIIVNGVTTFIDGECTNETPGELLRYRKDEQEETGMMAAE